MIVWLTNYKVECYNIKKLEALTNIFNQCFIVEPRWEYDYSVDESKFVGYDVATSDFSEMVCIILDNQYKKIIASVEGKRKEIMNLVNLMANPNTEEKIVFEIIDKSLKMSNKIANRQFEDQKTY